MARDEIFDATLLNLLNASKTKQTREKMLEDAEAKLVLEMAEQLKGFFEDVHAIRVNLEGRWRRLK